MKNPFLKFTVMDDTDVHNTDIIGCQNGRNGCNGTGFVHQIDKNLIGRRQQAFGVAFRNIIPVFFGGCEGVQKPLQVIGLNGIPDFGHPADVELKHIGNLRFVFRTDLLPHFR